MIIIERAVGQFPVSIGTSLAFEGLLGIHPNQQKQPTDVRTIAGVWVNLRTMARNMYNAIQQQHKDSPVDLEAAIELLVNEVQVLPNAVEQAGYKGKVSFYLASMDAPKWAFPRATFKETKSSKILQQNTFERIVAIEAYNRLKEDRQPVFEVDTRPKSGEGIIALVTHYPHELLWKPMFTRLLLLESHTGKLKTYQQWYTKLNKDDDTQMPFNEFTLQVFGDNVLLSPQSLLIRKELIAIAKAKRWTGITQQEQFYHDVMRGSKELQDLYKLLRR